MSDGGAQFYRFGPYFNSDGTLYTGIKINVYAAGTTNNKTYWTDESKSPAGAHPLEDSDSDGLVAAYFDGDYRFQIKDSDGNDLDTALDYDNVKITSDTATMWEGNQGTSYPSAATANRWQMAVKHTAGNVFQSIGINNGSSFQDILYPIGKGSDIASASTLVLGTDGNIFDVTGTTGITAIATTGKTGFIVKLHFDGALTITHQATNLILQYGQDIITYAGLELEFYEYAAGAWRQTIPTRTIGKGADIASASTLVLGNDGNIFDVTGTTTITAFSSVGIGVTIKLHFDGILTLTHNATDLILPGGANITTAAGDEVEFYEYASGDYRLTKYTKADGTLGQPSATDLTLTGTAASPPDSNTLTKENIVKGWISFNGTGTIARNADFNVSGITDNGTGDYTITWDTDFANINYAISGTARLDTNVAIIIGINSTGALTVGAARIATQNVADALIDCSTITIIAIGEQ